MQTPIIEVLVTTLEGRCLLGQIAAAEGLASTISHHLAMLDISDEWRMDIERARLEKLRDMTQKDGDASLLYAEADRLLQRQMKNYVLHEEAGLSVIQEAPVFDSADMKP